MWCDVSDVMWRDVVWCDVMWCDVVLMNTQYGMMEWSGSDRVWGWNIDEEMEIKAAAEVTTKQAADK
jgi:hypothetical protein